MSKFVKISLALALVGALATPALAEFKFGGMFRLQGIATNSDDTSTVFDGQNTVDPKTKAFVDQRVRMKLDYIMNENVKFVYFNEIDSTWGSTAATGDGGPGGDQVDVETKNLYLEFKTGMFNVTAGLQGIGGRYEGLVVSDDWSALKVAFSPAENLKLTLLWAKPDEGANQAKWDDTDFYNVSLDLKASDALALAFDLGWLDCNQEGGSLSSDGAGDSHLFNGNLVTNPYDLYILGARADIKLAQDLGLNAFALYAMAEDEVTKDELAGYVLSAQLSAKVADMAVAGRLTYMSADDFKDNDSEAFIPNLGGNYDFAKENLMIFYTDAFYNNGPGGRLATEAATLNGTGLIGLNVKADAKFGAYYAKAGAGYFLAADTPSGWDDDMGGEVALRVGRVVADKVDISVNGAYAMLGDYWELAGGTPDDIWKTTLMVNVNF